MSLRYKFTFIKHRAAKRERESALHWSAGLYDLNAYYFSRSVPYYSLSLCSNILASLFLQNMKLIPISGLSSAFPTAWNNLMPKSFITCSLSSFRFLHKCYFTSEAFLDKLIYRNTSLAPFSCHLALFFSKEFTTT